MESTVQIFTVLSWNSLTVNSRGMSAETPARFWTTNSMCISEVGSKFAKKELVTSNIFFCRQDPMPATFEMVLKFGAANDSWLQARIRPTNRAVSITRIKYSLYDDEGAALATMTQVNDKQKYFLTEKNITYGWEKFYQYTKAANDRWRIAVEVGYEASPCLKAHESASLKDDFLKLLESPKNSDITFLVKESKIEAHRVVLSARSAYFSAMFESGMKESVTNEIKIDDTDPEVIRGMLHYLYSATPPENLDKIAMRLLTTSDEYGLEDLKMMCESSISANLNSETVVDALILAAQHNCLDLVFRARAVLRANIGKVKQSESDWGKLKANPNLLMELLEAYCQE